MEKTRNYQLNQWAAGDKVQRVDFNADNAKIDAAIKAVDAKADTRAAQTALDALAATVSGHTSALAGKGNCQIAAGTYTGTGKYGSASPSSPSWWRSRTGPAPLRRRRTPAISTT